MQSQAAGQPCRHGRRIHKKVEMVQNSNVFQNSSYTTLSRGEEGRPGWAYGLRQLYRTVVEEPMPTGFKDMLAKLDRLSEGRLN
jgi:hypothetical protein